MAGPAPSARTGGDRSPRICRGSRGRAAPYTWPLDRLSATRRVRGYSSGHHAEGLRRQAWLPHESTASPESPEGVDSALQLVMYAVPFAPCLLGQASPSISRRTCSSRMAADSTRVRLPSSPIFSVSIVHRYSTSFCFGSPRMRMPATHPHTCCTRGGPQGCRPHLWGPSH